MKSIVRAHFPSLPCRDWRVLRNFSLSVTRTHISTLSDRFTPVKKKSNYAAQLNDMPNFGTH